MQDADLPKNEAFLEGLRLFNEGQFWHAHEAWEALWLQSSDPRRQFVQGLIQVAAALVHWQRGNLRGLHLNWYKARQRFEGLPDIFGGIDLRGLHTWMDSMDAVLTTTPPYLRLIDPPLAPHSGEEPTR